MTDVDKPFTRRIKSFVVRSTRMTVGQQRGWDAYWETLGIKSSDQRLNLSEIFGNERPVVFEIGFGMGASLFEMARDNANYNFIGVEVHRPGVGAVIASGGDAALSNLRVMCCDANHVIDKMLADESLHRVQLFFPDPWHKTRHHKRRLVQSEFVQRIRNKLVKGGHFHMATDWEPYAMHMLETMNAQEGYRNLSPGNSYVDKPDYRPETKFERRGLKLGHGVWDLVYEKC